MTVLVLAGTIGAGKSTLTEMLAEELKTQAFYESVDDNKVLPLFYENPQKYLIFRIIGLNSKTPKFYIIDPYENHDEFESVEDLIEKVFNAECIQFKIFNVKPYPFY